jgi:hypothetical protein
MNVSLDREAKLMEGLSTMYRAPTTVLSDGRLMLASTALERTDRAFPPAYVSEGRLIVARAVFDWMTKNPFARVSSVNVILVAGES